MSLGAGAVKSFFWARAGCVLGLVLLGMSGCMTKAHTTVVSGETLEHERPADREPEAPVSAGIGEEMEPRGVPEDMTAALEEPTVVQPFPLVKEVAPESVPEPSVQPAPPVKSEAETAQVPAPAAEGTGPSGVPPSSKEREEPSPQRAPGESPRAELPAPAPVAPPREFLEEPLPAALADVFFDYDRHTIRADAIPVLEGNARLLLVKYPNRRVVIEGHCDERGTVAYNLALGARRAQAVKEYLVDLGVPAETIDIISYGKEKPFCREHSLKCWQLNRRGHFVLK